MSKRTMHLFAGIGGGLLADLILGHTPVVAVEWESYACKVLRERAAEGWFPGLHVWEGDVRLFDPSEYAGSVDIIHAGFPCQPFSVAGSRKGSQDERGELFAEVIRCVEAIRPKQIFLENVPGLTTSKSPSCVCGWPYRRGGLYQDSSSIETDDINIHRNCSDEHVKQGASSWGANERTVWREPVRSGLEECEVVGSMAMAYQRGYSKQIREGNSPIFDAETAASGPDSCAGQPEGVSADSKEWNEGVDSGCEGEGGINEGADAPLEPEGSKCPNCSRGLVSAEPGLVWYMETICGTLAAMGYDSRWLCIRASDVGAPHHRDRWFLLANAERSSTIEQPESNLQRGRTHEAEQIGVGGFDVANTTCQRYGTPEEEVFTRGHASEFGDWWSSEPGVQRVAYGIPDQLGQLKGYGNAQVPLQSATAYRLLGGQ